ncbi:GNAT family N-acetyltransferase [Actinokineospora enzanensis]|uniref:GNAT family N-acetyltransferase n=1 Tax=Actinokineospora enzanensis TaxID=155975 RepID=UPI0003754539|nr:GNAT family N-acetyltransferase [Actinokineospora enzanensis]
MTVLTHGSVRDFWAVAGPLFRADPVRHTVAMTVLHRLLAIDGSGERVGRHDPLLFTVDRAGSCAGAVFATPPWPISVSGLPTDVHGEVIDHLIESGIELSGVQGPCDVAEPFTRAWSDRTGATVTAVISERLYRLGTLSTPNVGGTVRLATEDDLPVLVPWYQAFNAEAHPTPQDLDVEGFLRTSLRLGRGCAIWTDGGVDVALASGSVPVEGMSRIGPVYTPPEHRGRGYGSAVTAAAARWAIAQGASDVLLFTDLDNPTSNSIYRKIGFRPVLDAVEITFDAGPTLDT